MARKTERNYRKKARGPGAPQGGKPTTPAAAPNIDWAKVPPLYIAAGLGALHLLLIALVFNPTIFTGGDNGVYVALSRALVNLREYTSIHDPVPSAHTYYPPGYPTILAIAALLGIQPWLPIKFVTVAFSVLGVVLSYFWIRRRSTPGVAIFAALVTAASPGLLANSHYELSDVPFWALIMLGLVALEAVPREARGRVVVAGLAAAAAYLTRTASLPIVVASLGWLGLERRWRQLAIFAAIIIPAMAWWSWWTSTHAAGNDYGNQFWYLDVYAPELGRANALQLLARIPANIKAYGEIMLPLLFRGQQGPFVFGLAFLALAITGWALRLRRFGLSEIIFPFYGGMLFLCPPPWAGERYMLPIIPLALAYVAEAVLWGVRKITSSLVVPVAIAGTGLFLLLSFGSLIERSREAALCRSAYRAGQPYGCLPPPWQDYLTIAEWAKSGLPQDAIVISRKPGLFFALSDRRGVDIPKTERPEEFFRIAKESNARYIVLDRVDYLTSFYSVPVVASYINSFCLVRAGATEGTAVLGILLDQPIAPTRPGQAPALTQCPAAFPESNAN